MWSPIDKVTAGAKSFELLIFRKYSNLMLEQCKSGDCGCVKKIGVVFVLYRFMVIVSYLLLLGGLWQLEVIIRKTIRNQCEICQRKAANKFIKECKSCAITDGDNESLDSSGDTIDENVYFVTFREAEDDGFQDDDYHDILANSLFASDEQLDLEALLQEQDIDWDCPVPIAMTPPLNDSFQGDSSEIYFDEDFLSILGVTEQRDFELLQIDNFLVDSNTTESSCVLESVRALLDVPLSKSPILDDDVVTAIVGDPNREEIVLTTAEIEDF